MRLNAPGCGAPSLRRYLIVETVAPGLLVLERAGADRDWIARALIDVDRLVMADLGIEIPVAAFYEAVGLLVPDMP
jgi:hypothetical protein